MKNKLKPLCLIFFISLIFSIYNFPIYAETKLNTTPNDPNIAIDYYQLGKVIDNLVSDNMKEMVNNAPTDNYMIYAFVFIAIFILITMIIVMKISANVSSKNMKYTFEPTLLQISETMARVQQSSEKMADKFSNLSEKIIETQAYKVGEEDKLEMILNRIQDIKKETSNSNASLHSAFREHQTIESDNARRVLLQLDKVEISLTNLQNFCKIKNGGS